MVLQYALLAELRAYDKMVRRKPQWVNEDETMVSVTLKLPASWLNAVDEWRRNQPSLPNRSDALREAIREKFVAEQTKMVTSKKVPSPKKRD
jgi:hypothetical protein